MDPDDVDFLKKITDLVIEAAHKGIPEQLILEYVDEGLDLVLGPRKTDDCCDCDCYNCRECCNGCDEE